MVLAGHHRGRKGSAMTIRKRLEHAVTCYMNVWKAVSRMRRRTRMPLRPQEAEAVKTLYNATPVLDSCDTILKLLRALGQPIIDYELDALLDGVMYQPGTHISLERVTRIMESLKRRHHDSVLPDTVEAFAALGGRKDKHGGVDASILRGAVQAFELTIDIDAMIAEVDTDGSGIIEFEEFSEMFDAAAAKNALPGTPRSAHPTSSVSSLSVPNTPDGLALGGGLGGSGSGGGGAGGGAAGGWPDAQHRSSIPAFSSLVPPARLSSYRSAVAHHSEQQLLALKGRGGGGGGGGGSGGDGGRSGGVHKKHAKETDALGREAFGAKASEMLPAAGGQRRGSGAGGGISGGGSGCGAGAGGVDAATAHLEGELALLRERLRCVTPADAAAAAAAGAAPAAVAGAAAPGGLASPRAGARHSHGQQRLETLLKGANSGGASAAPKTDEWSRRRQVSRGVAFIGANAKAPPVSAGVDRARSIRRGTGNGAKVAVYEREPATAVAATAAAEQQPPAPSPSQPQPQTRRRPLLQTVRAPPPLAAPPPPPQAWFPATHSTILDAAAGGATAMNPRSTERFGTAGAKQPPLLRRTVMSAASRGCGGGGCGRGDGQQAYLDWLAMSPSFVASGAVRGAARKRRAVPSAEALRGLSLSEGTAQRLAALAQVALQGLCSPVRRVNPGDGLQDPHVRAATSLSCTPMRHSAAAKLARCVSR